MSPNGTLDLLILKTLETMGPMHGYRIARRIEQVAENLLRLNQGSIYPALIRLEQQDWIRTQWGVSTPRLSATTSAPEGVPEEGIVTSLESVRSSLRCERIDIGQRVALVERAKPDVGRHRINLARRYEVAPECVEERAVRPDEIEISEIQKSAGSVRDLSFEFAHAEFETATFRPSAWVIIVSTLALASAVSVKVGLSRLGGTPSSCT